MRGSCVCLSVIACLTASLAAAAQVDDETQPVEEPVAEEPAAEAEGPPAPAEPSADEPAGERGQVLVLPTRTPVGAGVDGATIDVLLASALQELGFQARDAEVVSDQLDESAPALDAARDAYLNMDLEGALAEAVAVRDAHLAHRGDLLADPNLAEAELFMVQVLIDLGRQTEAAELAARVLVRRPDLRLDPADHSQAMLALWSATVLGQTGRNPKAPGEEELATFGAEVGVDWVVLGVWRADEDKGASMLVLVVPTAGDEPPSQHVLALGPRARWAGAVEAALLERFPPPPPPSPPSPPGLPPGPGDPNGEIDEDGKWYKSWWFWTIVSVAVVGGTAGAVGGYYSTREEQNPDITGNGDQWWGK
jgi:hypothetical protein